MLHAVPEDLSRILDSIPANAELLIARASRDVDRVLLCSIYDASDPAVIKALREATIEQVAGTLAGGDQHGFGIASTPQSFTIGKISVQGAAGGQPPRTGGLVDQAYAVLQAAGLTGHAVQERWP